MPSATLASCPDTLERPCFAAGEPQATTARARHPLGLGGLAPLALALVLSLSSWAWASGAQAQSGTVIPRTNAIDLATPEPASSSTKKTAKKKPASSGGSTRGRRPTLPADPGSAPPVGQGFLKIIRLGPSGSLSLREGPGTEYSRITLLPGDTVGILPVDAFGRWTKITYCGFEGWVSASFTAPMLANESPVHACRTVGPLGLNADPAAQGSDGSLVGATPGLTAGLLPAFSNAELTRIATDEFDLPIRLTSSGRRMGQAPSQDPYLECIYEAEQDPSSEAICVQASLSSWQQAMGEALERHRQITNSSSNKDLERNQAAWRSYAQGTCNDFADENAPPVLKSHRETCQLMFTRNRALELEQLLVQIDDACRLCQRETAEPDQQADSGKAADSAATNTN